MGENGRRKCINADSGERKIKGEGNKEIDRQGQREQEAGIGEGEK